MSDVIFADRTNWQRATNALTKAYQRVRERPEGLDLTISNPTQLQLNQIIPGDLQALSYEPQAMGLKSAREAISSYYRRRDIAVEPERIVITSSTSEAYHHIFRLLCNPGDLVSLPSPSYPLFSYLAKLADVTVTPYRIEYDGSWYLDQSTLSEEAKAIVLVSPNNPTGSFLSPPEREAIDKLGTPLISDEVFADYTSSHRDASWINNTHQLSFTLNGLSKVAGLPQHKLAWMVLSGPEQEVQEATARLELMLDTYLSVSSGIQNALPDVLDKVDAWQDTLKLRIAKNRSVIGEKLKQTAITLRASQGGWYAILQMPNIRTDEEWALLAAQEQDLLVQPGYFYDMRESSCLVLSLIGEPETIETGIDRLISLQEGYTG